MNEVPLYQVRGGVRSELNDDGQVDDRRQDEDGHGRAEEAQLPGGGSRKANGIFV